MNPKPTHKKAFEVTLGMNAVTYSSSVFPDNRQVIVQVAPSQSITMSTVRDAKSGVGLRMVVLDRQGQVVDRHLMAVVSLANAHVLREMMTRIERAKHHFEQQHRIRRSKLHSSQLPRKSTKRQSRKVVAKPAIAWIRKYGSKAGNKVLYFMLRVRDWCRALVLGLADLSAALFTSIGRLLVVAMAAVTGVAATTGALLVLFYLVGYLQEPVTQTTHQQLLSEAMPTDASDWLIFTDSAGE